MNKFILYFTLLLTGIGNLLCGVNEKPLIHFKEASLDQAEFLTQLAMDSNATYRYRTVSDEKAKEIFQISANNFKKGVVRIMLLGSEIIGFYGLKDEIVNGKVLHTLSHLFLKPGFIGKGYGRTLFQEVIRVAKEELGWSQITWESDPNAEWFYKKMGAQKIADRPSNFNPTYRAPIFTYLLR